MGIRSIKRKQQRTMSLQERVEKTREKEKSMEQLVTDAMREAEAFTKHHITGELYTAAAVILRRAPYRWPADKVMRFLDQIGGVIVDLNEGRICDADLVAEGEKYGIRVIWRAFNDKYRFINDLSIYEEHGNEEKN